MGDACMKFYAVEDRLAEAIYDGRTKVRVRAAFDFSGSGEYVAVPESDILELTVTSLKEKTGGTITQGTLVLDNTTGSYCPRFFDTYRPAYNKYNGLPQADGLGNLRPGRMVQLSYTTGNDIPFVKRFLLYVDDNGFQQTATGYTGRVCTVGLVDLAERLKQTDKQKDWTSPEVIVHSSICDKEFPASSIVHRIAARAGLIASDIDCSTVTEYLPYVKLTRSVWAELSDLATVYNAHLETALEKPLVFVNTEDEIQYVFDNSNVNHIRMHDLRDQYRNTLRLRWTRYREFSGVELWRYTDPPVIYTGTLTPTYPFVAEGENRDIEKAGYEARYTLQTDDGKTRSVVYAENVDTQGTFTANIITSGPALRVTAYDVTTLRDRASVRLEAATDTVLLSAAIKGDAIAGETSFSHYIDDPAEAVANGTVAENITTPYLSETLRDGVPYYQTYASSLLSKLKRARKGFFLKTNRGTFHARVGAPVRINMADGLISERAEIVQMELRYKMKEAFVASFFLEEE
jgi:hypothetical protein